MTSVKVLQPEGGSIGEEPTYGNRIYHVRFEGPFEEGAKLEAEIEYVIHRTAIEVEAAKTLSKTTGSIEQAVFSPYLAANRLIPLTGPVETVAKELDLGGLPPILVGRTIYDYLIDSMEYNWLAEGAGEGDVLWACDSKTGDCTDYNSIFLALCRSQGIPADHVFGYPIRSEKEKGRIPSFHCAARFYVEDVGWVPVDPSEADKHPELKGFYFGSQSANYMIFSHGRDIDLVPKQAGPPLNFFIHPYVEVDGAQHERVKYRVMFENIAATN